MRFFLFVWCELCPQTVVIGLKIYHYSFDIAFLNSLVNSITVQLTAIISAAGSARKTAVVLSAINAGRMYISGISRIIFLSKARKRLHFALPREIKVCWQAICAPNTQFTAI